jgi:flagellin-like protein
VSERALSPVIGCLLLTAITVAGAVIVGAAVAVEPPSTAPAASFDAEAEADGTVRLTHRGGATIDPETLRVRVRVDGESLDAQPPVPFFSARGFESGPTGPFNSARTGDWRAGETASFRIAGTNSPNPYAGASVEIRLYADGHEIAELTVIARAVG